MSVLQYNKYIWLVDTIRSAGKITKEDIDRNICHIFWQDPWVR